MYEYPSGYDVTKSMKAMQYFELLVTIHDKLLWLVLSITVYTTGYASTYDCENKNQKSKQRCAWQAATRNRQKSSLLLFQFLASIQCDDCDTNEGGNNAENQGNNTTSGESIHLC